MLRLDTVNRTLQVLLAGAVETSELPIVVSFSDKDTLAYVGSTKRSVTNGVTAVDICDAPAASTIRDIDMLTVVNIDTKPATVTIRLNDNGTYAPAFSVDLPVGSQINYTHGQGFKVIDRNGAPHSAIQMFHLEAGATIAINDAVEIGPDGKGYQVVCTDYAAVTNFGNAAQTSTATGRIITQTSLTGSMTNEFYGRSVVTDSDGSIFVANTNGSGHPTLRKFSAAGTLIRGPVVVEAAASTCRYLELLSNGNIAIVYRQSNSLKYAVYDKYLNVVKSVTTIDSSIMSSSVFGVTALSGGGFAVVYQANSSTDSLLLTYDNSGTAVLASTAIWTRAGTVGYVLHRMAQLSDGNLVIVANSGNSSGDIGTFHGVVTTSGVSVVAFTNEDSTDINNVPQVSVMSGYFCVARSGQSGTHVKARIYSNAGVLQGGAFSGLCNLTSLITGNHVKVFNDGVYFWLFWQNTTSGYATITRLPVTGTNYVSNELSSSASIASCNVDAFFEYGLIVVIAQNYPSTTNSPVIWVIDVNSLSLTNSGTTIGSGATSSYYWPQIIPGGDFSFLALYDNGAVCLTAGKYANTAIMGVAASPAIAGDSCNLYQSAGTYPVNPLKGTSAVAFDHTAGANIPGNKGSLLTSGAVLKGM